MQPARIASVALLLPCIAAAGGCGRRPDAVHWRGSGEPRPRLRIEQAWKRPLPFCPTGLAGDGEALAWFLDGDKALAVAAADGVERPDAGAPPAPPPAAAGAEELADRLTPDGQERTAAAVWKERGFFVLRDAGVLQAVSLRSGKPLWSVRAGAGARAAPQVIHGRVLFQSLDNHLYLLRARSGHEVWRARAAGRLVRPAALWSDRALVIAQSSGEVEAFDLFDGSRCGSWSLPGRGSRFVAGPLLVGDLLLAAQVEEGGTRCFGLALRLAESH